MAISEPQRTEAAMADIELAMLLDRLPGYAREVAARETSMGPLLEVVLDLGRPPELRFAERAITLADTEVSEADLASVVERVGTFGEDNRAGLERTLHRISALRNRAGKVVGLTCRVGRAIEGTAKVIEDIVRSGRSVLLVGRPGVGKTTMLREIARMLADEAGKRVVIVDTSNEIAGDGDIPHPAIGRARRLQVPTPDRQHAVMIEAVENHMPEVIVIDEMGTAQEAVAARTIAERGVQLIATAHGNTLENLLANPTLSDLVGGVQAVTLSDEEARRRRTQKTVLERQAPPTFDVLVEIQSWERVAVHAEVAQTVDRILRGQEAPPESRWISSEGVVERSRSRAPGASPPPRDLEIQRRPFSTHAADDLAAASATSAVAAPLRVMRVFPFGVSGQRLAQAGAEAGLSIVVTERPEEAELVLTTKAHYRRRPGLLLGAEAASVPVHVLRRNTLEQMHSFLTSLNEASDAPRDDELAAATVEAEAGVRQIAGGESTAVELEPQSSFIRRVQHRIAERAMLKSSSTGREPSRRVTIHRG